MLLAERRLPFRRAALTAGAAALVWALVLLRYRHGLGDIWTGAVTYHEKARAVPGVESANEYRLRTEVLGPHVAWAWLIGLGVLGALVADRARRETRALWLFAFVAGAFLIWHRPLHDNHLVLLAPAAVAAAVCVVAAARLLPRPLGAAAIAAAAIAVGAAYVSSFRERPRPSGARYRRSSSGARGSCGRPRRRGGSSPPTGSTPRSRRTGAFPATSSTPRSCASRPGC